MPAEASTFSPINALPAEVQTRLNLWTGDARMFSTAVVNIARQNYPHSNAYKLGDVTADSSGFLGTSTNAAADSLESQIPNPANVFRLQWHKAMLKVKGDPESAPGDEETSKLSRMHAYECLRVIKSLVQNNANFKADPDRFPNLEKVVHGSVI